MSDVIKTHFNSRDNFLVRLRAMRKVLLSMSVSKLFQAVVVGRLVKIQSNPCFV